MIKNAKELVTYRKDSKLSRAELASRINVSGNYLYLIESERKPWNARIEQKLAQYENQLEAKEEEKAAYGVDGADAKSHHTSGCPNCELLRRENTHLKKALEKSEENVAYIREKFDQIITIITNKGTHHG